MTTTSAPPGWYADPTLHGSVRWWDGHRWTAHVQAAPTPGPVAPTRPPSPAHPPPTVAAAGPSSDLLDISSGEPDGGIQRGWWTPKLALIPVGLLILAGVIGAMIDGPAADSIASGSRGVDIEALAGSVPPATDEPSSDESTPSGQPSTSTTPRTPLSAIAGDDDSTAGTTGSPEDVDVPTTLAPPVESSTTAATAAAVSTTASTAPEPTVVTTASTVASTSTTAARSTTVVPTTVPTTAPTTTPTTGPTTTEAPACHPAYRPCLPYHPGDALNCGDLSAAQKPVTVLDVAVDPYGLDGNNDGVGCESG